MKKKLNNVLDTTITLMKSESDATQEQIDDILENNTPLMGFFKVAKLCGYNVCMNGPHKKPVWLIPEDFIDNEERCLMLKTKDTNPMHFFESTDHYFKIIRKKGVKEYGQWMFNNGYNTALVECRIKLRELETKIQKLEEAVQQNESN